MCFCVDRLLVDKIYFEDGAIVTKNCLPYTKEDLTPVCSLENVFLSLTIRRYVSLRGYIKVKTIQRPGTEATRTQIQPSKPKRK